MTVTPREQFCTLLAAQPLIRCDVLAVLSGDGEARVELAAALMAQAAAPMMLITGGRDAPPFSLTAKELTRRAIGCGVAFDRILLDEQAQNTHEQAVNVVATAKERDWKRILIVASPYHMPRAFLTFLRELQNAGLADTVRLIPAPPSFVAALSLMPWFESPPGESRTRLALLGDEFDKCARYVEHVATFEDGIAYLRHWEAKR
jgi:uncharacterized SAM-binding protein YcdF (DUF218 family)